jgi:YjjG family noncanonical pyrimidine nucleotidase
VNTKKYKTVFFDLDHTLWDFDTNSRETLEELYGSYQLDKRGVTSFKAFHEIFNEVNSDLWSQYDKGLIKGDVIRAERFKRILAPFEITDEALIAKLSHEYLYTCPRKGTLLPGAMDTLNYLSEKYSLSLITNGFDEVQHMKLASGKIAHYFKHVVTSQQAGHKKPSREIFDYALGLHANQANEAVMIGDNLETDVAGALNASVDAVFYNPKGISHDQNPHHEIINLNELQLIL